MDGRKRTVQIKFRVTEAERDLILEKMKLVPTRNMAAYLRKIAIDGYIIQIDHADIKAMTAEIQKIGVNVNQIARRVNATGNAYQEDIEEIKGVLAEIWRLQTYYRLTQSRLSPLLSERNIVIKTPYFMGAAKIISESNLVMLLSDIMADWFISLGALRRIPVVSEEFEHVQSKGFVTKLIWHERSHLDPAMQWMRGMISYAVKETLSGGHVVHPEEGR